MASQKIPHIVITSGEPAGIGPDLCAMLSAHSFNANITILCDKNVFDSRKKIHDGANDTKSDALQGNTHAPSRPALLISPQITLQTIAAAAPVIAGTLNPQNSRYVLQMLDIAIDGCMSGKFDAMVTAPVHKGVINDAGITFTGHTEYLAERTKTPHVVMMLVGGDMRVALATIHIALKDVPAAINKTNLAQTIRILHADLVQKFGIKNPRILVAGLNPHAGEDGYLGREEIEIINPVLAALRLENMDLVGALPADTLFAKHHLAHADAVLAMYHDQGLPVLKHASFGGGVNVTLGLPIIRTSVDHGTALDLAGGESTGTNKINIGSMLAAIELAIELANNRINKAST
jgi:4-hydroxythreonine-4-phosphate dehydrogenase